MKKYLFTESQLKKIIDSELDERSRSLANTRKKRLFPKSAMMSNPDRFKEYDKETKGLNEEEVAQDQELDSYLMQAGIILTPEEKSEIEPECKLEIPQNEYTPYIEQIGQKLNGMDKKGLVSTLKQVLSLKNKKSSVPVQEQMAPIIIAGVSVPGVAVVAIAGFIALMIIIKLAKLIFSGGGRRRVNPGCKRKRRLIRRFGVEGLFRY